MSYINNKHKYLEMFLLFCNSSISAKVFVKSFSELWEADRDEEYEKTKNWERPFDVELLNDFQQGAISKETFNKRWNELYGLTEEISSLCNILDRAYTACDCFWPDIPESEVEPPLVINETLLREEVTILLNELNEHLSSKDSSRCDCPRPLAEPTETGTRTENGKEPQKPETKNIKVDSGSP